MSALENTNPSQNSIQSHSRARPYYGWTILLIAAAAMVGTLPGRTQGLGIITEPLIADLQLSRIQYAQINLWATLIGSLFCIGVGQLQDRVGSRSILTAVALALGLVVVAISRTATIPILFVLITLTRGLGQSALSVVSLTMVGQWFRRRIDFAMAVYTVVMSIGFMIAFPTVGALVTQRGWRFAWGGVGWALILVLAPIALLFVKRSPEAIGLSVEGAPSLPDDSGETGFTLREALSTFAFWIMAAASSLYGLIASGIGLFNESVLHQRGFAPGVYHETLVVTALTALVGNFFGGYVAAKGNMNRLMSAAMVLLMIGLAALPNVRELWQVMAVAVIMGIAGGFVMVLFFSFWARVYGRTHLGKIQGAAQTMTVLASAVGPLILAECFAWTGSYAICFYLLALVVAVLAVCAWTLKIPTEPHAR